MIIRLHAKNNFNLPMNGQTHLIFTPFVLSSPSNVKYGKAVIVHAHLQSL